jgi:hypothetical protein
MSQRLDGRAAWAKLTPGEQAEVGRLAMELAYLDLVIDLVGSPAHLGQFISARRVIHDLLSRLFSSARAKDRTLFRVRPEAIFRGLPPVDLPSISDEAQRRLCRACGYTEITPFADDNARWVWWDLCADCWEPN